MAICGIRLPTPQETSTPNRGTHVLLTVAFINENVDTACLFQVRAPGKVKGSALRLHGR